MDQEEMAAIKAAADTFKRETLIIEQSQARRQVAEQTLKDYCSRRGLSVIEGVRYAESFSWRLNAVLVKAELGDRLPQFQKRVRSQTLSVEDR